MVFSGTFWSESRLQTIEHSVLPTSIVVVFSGQNIYLYTHIYEDIVIKNILCICKLKSEYTYCDLVSR